MGESPPAVGFSPVGHSPLGLPPVGYSPVTRESNGPGGATLNASTMAE